MQAKMNDLMVGINIIEAAHKKAAIGELSNAPFPMVGEQASIHLQAQASALGHALDMLNASDMDHFIKNGYGSGSHELPKQQTNDTLSPGI